MEIPIYRQAGLKLPDFLILALEQTYNINLRATTKSKAKKNLYMERDTCLIIAI
jgi:hypothetical protein